MPPTKPVRTVCVIGLADGPEAGPGPAALACLDPGRFRRIAAALHPMEGGAYRTDLFERVVRLPDPASEEGPFVEDLSALVALERIAVVIPASERAIPALAKHKARLEEAGASVPLPDEATLGNLWTGGLLDACRNLSIATSQSVELPGDPSGNPLTGDFRFPAAVAADNGMRSIAADASEAIRWQAVAREHGAERVLALEWDPDRHFEVAIVADRRRGAVACAAVRVLADDERGRAWMAVTVDDPALREEAEGLAFAMKIEGAAVLAFIGERRRLACGLRLGLPLWAEGAAFAGVNLALGLVLSALGETVEGGHAEAGIVFSQTAEDLVVPAEALLDLATTKRVKR